MTFWQEKSLSEMTQAEWESLCDGCGRCCLVKLEDEVSGEILTTSVTCKLLDTESCRCGNYARRHELVSDCIKLSPDNVENLSWLPATCAYRVLGEGGSLAWWHPLVSGSAETVIEAGISLQGKVLSEAHVAEEDLVNFIWPEIET